MTNSILDMANVAVKQSSNPLTDLFGGLSGGAMNIKRLRPKWQKLALEAQQNGEEFPSFEEWVKTQNQDAAGVLPR